MTDEQSAIAVLGVAVACLFLLLWSYRRRDRKLRQRLKDTLGNRDYWRQRCTEWQSRCETLSEANAILIRGRDRAQAETEHVRKRLREVEQLWIDETGPIRDRAREHDYRGVVVEG